MRQTRTKQQRPGLLLRLQGAIPKRSILDCTDREVSCAPLMTAGGIELDQWKQLWHHAIRSISVPSTSRAACLLLHRILEADILPYNLISEDINSVVTTADVNGPGLLSDTSLALMFHLFHLRNARVPGASQATSSHIIRWVFLRWNPSESASNPACGCS